MVERPERVAVEPTVTQRVIGPAGSAAVAFLIKAALERVNRPRPRTRQDPPEPQASHRERTTRYSGMGTPASR